MRVRAFAIYGFFLLLFAVAADCVLGKLSMRAGDRSFRVAHPFYHHTLLPNQSATPLWGGRRYTMHTNSIGFRDEEATQIDPQSPVQRTLLIGDSMVEGLGMEYSNTVAGLLAARGRARGVEVLNAASVSYSPKLYDLKTRWLVEHEKLAFQRLIVFLDISDIQDETNYEAFVPRERIGWLAAGAAWWRRHALSWQIVERFALGRSGIDNRFKRDADIHVWMDSVDAYRNATSNPEAGRWEWTYDDAVYAAWGARGLALAEANMSRLAAFCREHGIEMTLVVYPSPFQIFANDLDSRQVKAWKVFSERERVGFVNLFPAFIDARVAGPDLVYQRYFIPDDVHWNEAGNALVADWIDAAAIGPRQP